jgi:16S rRNA (uracil1498-N3)-methyltransferase
MNRFYIDATLAVHAQINLTDTVFHHWCRVLRAKIGDQALLFNGQGGEYLARLSSVEKKTATVQIEQFFADDRVPEHKVTLGQVMSKGDRMDYAIQKATELGVYQIQLLSSERCEMHLKYQRDQKKLMHWQGIAIAACEQCGMNRIPQILPPIPLAEWVAQSAAPLKLVMAFTDTGYMPRSPQPEHIAVLIGPEGGLTAQEIALANQHGFQSWTLGARVLRTETAPVVALSILNTL